MSEPNLAEMMMKAGKEKVTLVEEILKRYGLEDVPMSMDTDSIYIGTFKISKECERELRALGFMVMKIEVGVGRLPE